MEVILKLNHASAKLAALLFDCRLRAEKVHLYSRVQNNGRHRKVLTKKGDFVRILNV